MSWLPEWLATTTLNLSANQEELTLYAQIYQRPLDLEPPAECLALIKKAKQELPLREVFVLRQPLSPLAGGGCNPETGEVWVLLREGQEDGIQQTQRALLHEQGVTVFWISSAQQECNTLSEW